MNTRTFHIAGKDIVLEAVEQRGNQLSFSLEGKQYHFSLQRTASGDILLEQLLEPGVWQRTPVSATLLGAHGSRVQWGNHEAIVKEHIAHQSAAPAASSKSPHAPMPGLVRQLLVKKGDKVANGQPLVVMEAMKLQMTLNAGADGTVLAIPVREGDMVAEGTLLVEVGDAK